MTNPESERLTASFSAVPLPRPGLLAQAASAAAVRSVPLARILHQEYGVPRESLLAALRAHYQCESIEYDERLPIPPELITNLPGRRLAETGWFPVIKDAGDGTIVVAARDPLDAAMRAEVAELIGPGPYEFRVALPDDIAWFIQDYLHAKPGVLIGTERTGLAFWRNTMAQWRTRLACYRTDLARARTALAFLRTGLSFVIISWTLLSGKGIKVPAPLAYGVMTSGLLLIGGALPTYLKIRRSRMTPPRHQTLVEVSAATLTFLENYQNLEQAVERPKIKETMLARLGDLLGSYCTIIFPVPSSRERTHLARERNVLAAQRTIAGCYRTIYARARTGLAFIRTGIAFVSIGIGLLGFLSPKTGNTLFCGGVIVIGVLLAIDGAFWYLPVRKEQGELPRTRSALLAG